jgi:hypothetical protein
MMINRKFGATTNGNDKEVKMTKSLRMVVAICFVVSLALVTPVLVVYGAATEFFGEDLGLGEGTRLASWPNAAAAEAEFLSHLSGVGTEDFESFTDGAGAPLSIDFGAAGNATIYGDGYISDVPTGTSSGRYPISGDKYWTATQTFYIEFSQPIAAFGFYATDIGDYSGQVIVELVNGGNRTYTIPNTINGSGGSVLFYGIIEDDPALQFTRANFGNTAAGTDYFGFDDFTIGTLEQVEPPPTTVGGSAYPINKLLLMLPWIGLAAIVGATSLLVLRRRRAQS